MTLLYLFLGLVLLIAGAEALVRGASRLASVAGISPLVVGLTVVAYGTSAPEMVVSVVSGYSGQGDIALGNVIGSNMFNVLFILGVSASIAPLVVSQQIVRLDVPVMIAVSMLAIIFSYNGLISRSEGIMLLAGAILYTIFLVRQSRKESKEIQDEYAREYGADDDKRSHGTWVLNLAYIVGGLAMLVLGARWLVSAAVSVAHKIGVSELIIGLTIVAAGTSLPEVATSIIASIRGERDIAVGNVVGSNIFNILVVLGLASLVAPQGIRVSPAVISFDLPVMIAVAVACLPIFFTGNTIARWEGLVFLGYYVAYTVYLIMAATQHDALPAFNMVMVWFVLPLTILTLLVILWRSTKRRR